jgi:hypothetical protein
MQSPLVSQSLAPHAPVVWQLVLQQCVPVPVGPQAFPVHSSSPAQLAPAPPFGVHTPLGPGFAQ